MKADTAPPIGIVTPGLDAASLSWLLGLSGATDAASSDARKAMVAAMIHLSANESATRREMQSRFPQTNDLAAAASRLSAAPMTEQAIAAYNANRPPVPLVGVSLNPPPPALNYPYVPLPGLDPTMRAAAEQLRAVLADAAFRSRLSAADLRDADGHQLDSPLMTAQTATSPWPTDTHTVVQALSTWTTVTRPARMLAVIDVSASMSLEVPGRGTREAVAVAAARTGLRRLGDRWTVGLWEFSTKLDGDKDYLPVAPIEPLADHRGELISALAGVRPQPPGPHGGTGLNDSFLAAFKAVRAGWDPDKVNSLIFLTDGYNDDPDGLTIDQLRGELGRQVDASHRIDVVILGIGTDVNEPDLNQIALATNGRVSVLADPSKIDDIFLQAIALRLGPT
jgi:hypothetical protein